MDKCDLCGDRLVFRYIEGTVRPLHQSGYCRGTRVEAPKRGLFRSSVGSYTYDSFVNPNAHCPECGQEVFFYQSRAGGRVYFDELGPPWPKHWCTDGSRVIGRTAMPSNPRMSYPAQAYRWQADGWEPFCVVEIKEVHNGRFLVLKGIFRGSELSVYLVNHLDFPRSAPMHLREQKAGRYELSTIAVGQMPTGTEIARSYRAFRTLQDCYLDRGRPRR